MSVSNTGMIETTRLLGLRVTREFYIYFRIGIYFIYDKKPHLCFEGARAQPQFPAFIHPRGYPLEITSHLPPLLVSEIQTRDLRVIFQYRHDFAPREIFHARVYIYILILFVLLEKNGKRKRKKWSWKIESKRRLSTPEERGIEEGVIDEGANII